ncbi:MAG: hypothetical protein ACXWJB_05280, partial [Limisphaerales bacterium]
MRKVISCALLALLANSLVLHAAPQLRLSDGTATITVVDGDANDQQPDAGVVMYNGPVGSKWQINVTVGLTKPSLGTPAEPFMDLDTYNFSTDAANLSILYSDTDFTAGVGSTFDAQVGGTSDGSVDFNFYLDSNNTIFGSNTLLASFVNQVNLYQASSNGPVNLSSPYAMTLEAKIRHTGAGSTGFDQQLTINPPHFQPPSIQCAGDTDLGCNPTTIPGCDTNSLTITASCGVSNITCSAAGPDIITGCVHERDLVYTVTDNCGQSTSCTQHIYWSVDKNAPSFTQCPTDMDLGCNPSTIPDCDLSQVSATDDCGRAVIVCAKSDSATGCAHTRTLTYTATDACGNSATCIQHLTWTADTTPPIFTKCAADVDLGCNPIFVPSCSTPNLVAATDNCGVVTVSCLSSESVSGCTHTRTLTFIAVDACLNTASCVQNITWTVNTAPPVITCSPDRTVQCGSGWDFDTPTATDDCSTPAITMLSTATNATAGNAFIATRCWLATDACGNSAQCCQNVTVIVNVPCNPLTDCTVPYPFASTNPLTSIAFNESDIMATNIVSVTSNCVPDQIRLYYNDEHALTLGVRAVVVKTASGTTSNNYPFTAMPSPTAPAGVTNPLVGTMLASGDQAGTDVTNRPMYPVLFITDLTTSSNPLGGDWQYGGQGIPPHAVFGTWKGAVRVVDRTHVPTVVTVTPDADPAKNNWNLGTGGDVAPAGLKNEAFSAEVRWNINQLGLIPGHSYRLYYMLHDGDQNKTGGDVGHDCAILSYGTDASGATNCPPPPCNPLSACTPPYPFSSTNPLTSIAFNESEVLRTAKVSVVSGCMPGTIQIFYNDEHAMSRGISQITVKTKTGTTVSNYTVSPLPSNPGAATNPAVGSQITSGNFAGTDTSGRPLFPSLFVTDITINPANPYAGDWQYGGTAIPPHAVFGTWKSATKMVDYTTAPPPPPPGTPPPPPGSPNITLTVGADPAKNN